jgi:branched-chain amino acid transport system substrate-binding protein
VSLKRTAALVVSMLLPLSAASCTTNAMDEASGSDLVIAADLELSGAYADVGITYQRALQLKVEQINASGGVRGHQLRLDVRDNRSDPTVSITNMNAFVGEDVVAIVTGYCGDCLLAVAKTVEDKGIPTISLAAANGVTTPMADRHYIFKIAPNPADDAAVLANELKGDDAASAAIVSTTDTTGHDAIEAFRHALGKVGIDLQESQTFQPTDTDVSQPVQTAIAHHPDALIVSAISTRAGAAAKAAKDAGFRGHIYFDQPAAGDLFLNGMGAGYTDGITMVATQSMVIDDIIATNPASVARRQWFNDYTSRYGNFSEYSTYAADAIRLIDIAVASTGGTGDHKAVRDAAEASQFEGLTGQIRMSPENHSGLVPQALTLLVARGDRWQPA